MAQSSRLLALELASAISDEPLSREEEKILIDKCREIAANESHLVDAVPPSRIRPQVSHPMTMYMIGFLGSSNVSIALRRYGARDIDRESFGTMIDIWALNLGATRHHPSKCLRQMRETRQSMLHHLGAKQSPCEVGELFRVIRAQHMVNDGTNRIPPTMEQISLTIRAHHRELSRQYDYNTTRQIFDIALLVSTITNDDQVLADLVRATTYDTVTIATNLILASKFKCKSCANILDKILRAQCEPCAYIDGRTYRYADIMQYTKRT